jgi:hypothetical protein
MNFCQGRSPKSQCTEHVGRSQRLHQFAEKHEMDSLDERIDMLGDRNRAVLSSLPTMFATSSRSICGKLAVALIEVCPHENEEAHLLIASILRDYRALHGS